MTGLKDICLQVRYEGNPSTLISAFYGRVSSVASSYRVGCLSLTVEKLIPAALGLSQILADRKPVRFLLSPPIPVSSQEPQLDEIIISELHAQLKRIAAAVAAKAPENLQELAAYFDLRVAKSTQLPSGLPALSTTIGFFTDQSGDTVSYQAEDTPAAANGITTPVALTTFWSWGDPQFKVRSAIELFDKSWIATESNPPASPASADLTLSLLTVLLHLDQHP